MMALEDARGFVDPAVINDRQTQDCVSGAGAAIVPFFLAWIGSSGLRTLFAKEPVPEAAAACCFGRGIGVCDFGSATAVSLVPADGRRGKTRFFQLARGRVGGVLRVEDRYYMLCHFAAPVCANQ